jgi:hypothetical protein
VRLISWSETEGVQVDHGRKYYRYTCRHVDMHWRHADIHADIVGLADRAYKACLLPCGFSGAAAPSLATFLFLVM